MYGTGFLPTDEVNLYRVERDELYLTGTSEVALAAMHVGEVLDADALPLRYAGYSTCFRREAGAAGKDTRGMFRVHQFDKVEMFVFCPPRGLPERARAAARDRGGARRRARPPLPRRQHRRRRPGRLGLEEVRHRGVVPGPGPLPRDHVDLEHDRLPVAPPRHPLPRGRRPPVRAHPQRDGRHGPRADRDPRELPGRGRRRRGARRAGRVRRSGPHRARRLAGYTPGRAGCPSGRKGRS